MAKAKTLAEKYSRGGSGKVAGKLPTRSPIMNFFLDGGLPLNAVTTIHGKEGSYKTTFVLEMLAQAQAMGGIAVAASNEDSVKRSRLAALGGDGDALVLKEHAPPEYLLTIERIRLEFNEVFSDIRKADLENVIELFTKGKPTKALSEWYFEKLEVPKTKRKDTIEIAKKLTGLKKSDPFMYLHPDHKTLICFAIDSGTNCGCEKGVDTEGKGIGNEAQAWRSFYRYQQFLDSRSLLLITNQTSTRFGDGYMTWVDEAAPQATFFHAFVRIRMNVRSSRILRMNREGKVSFDESYKDPEVGAAPDIMIKKNKVSGRVVSFPQVMWKTSGTDTPWTIFELLAESGTISKNKQTGQYTFLQPVEDGKLVEHKFYLKDFYEKVYMVDELRAELFRQTQTVLSNMSNLPSDTLQYGETVQVDGDA